MTEPRWRTLLCWASVLTFFGLPLLIFVSQASGLLPYEQHHDEFNWLERIYQINTALVFGLAGLNSWDRRNGTKKP